MPGAPAILLLADGSSFLGRSEGAEGVCAAPIALNTSMSGYQELLSDPASAGQLLCLSAAQVGNYGVNRQDLQSDRFQASGLIARNMTRAPSNYRAEESLQSWLKREEIIAISGVDTRAVALHLRQNGPTVGLIAAGKSAHDLKALRAKLRARSAQLGAPLDNQALYQPGEHALNALERLGADHPAERPGPRLLIVDLGLKYGLLRALTSRGFRLNITSPRALLDDVAALKPDGVLFSSGPGSPALGFDPLIEAARVLAAQLPTFGVGLGCGILARAFGAETEELAFSPRGAAQPVRAERTRRVLMTYQNQGFALCSQRWPDALIAAYTQLNTQRVAGFYHRDLPVMGVQFHPEGNPGAHDARDFFAEMSAMMSREQV